MVALSNATEDTSCGFLPLVPKPQESQDTLQHPGRSAISLEKVARKAKTSTKSTEEWDAKRMAIHDLYIIHDLPLPEVIKIMENKNSFSQSYVIPFVLVALRRSLILTNCLRRKQYTTKLKEWGYEKNIRETDMRAIAHKDFKRKAEDALRPSTFRLRGKPVPNHKIERYEKEKCLFDDEFDPIEATPSFISCDTPRSMPNSPTVQPETSMEVWGTSNQLRDMNRKSSGLHSIDSQLNFLDNPLGAYVASAIMNSREKFVTSTPEGRFCCLVFEITEMVLDLDFALGGPVLEVNTLNDQSDSSRSDFHAYNPSDLWQMMHCYVVQCTQYPEPGYRTPEFRLQWNFHDQLLAEGIIKLEFPNKLLTPTSDIMEDLQDTDRTEPRA